MKRPEEAERKDDPKYCKYHRLVGDAIQDCFVFKNKVMQLDRQGKISLENDFAATNLVSTNCGSLDGKRASYNTTYTINEDGLLEKKDSSNANECMFTITFMDEDLLIGSKPHNHPLFVAGYAREQKELGVPMDELSNSRLMILGFNQGGQRLIGAIRMKLLMDDMVSTALFHIIDTKTSYNILLGHPWLHENFVVPSTWHQCLKYFLVIANLSSKLSHTSPMLSIVSMMLRKEKRSYPPKSQSHNSQSIRNNDSSTIEVEPSKGLTLSLTQINMKQPSKPPLKGFLPSIQEEEGGHEVLAIDRKRFDPKAFKLLIKAEYNPKEKLSLEKLPSEVTGKKLHGLNVTQMMLKEK
ncbi:UNVERIFIED_CONTAM: hypothetical protein Sradi_5242200 [Sesamum radiatum]|uniref:Uncharacterized protein n=1 Tax=Sesamum radiatum TaxID=300843 RepID=A0AAW2LM56_SESRA